MLQWLCAQVAPDSRLVLLEGDFQCTLGWPRHKEVAPVLLVFVAHMHLPRFVHSMAGPTWVSAQGLVRASDSFLGRNASPEVGVDCVKSESTFPSTIP